MEAGSTIVASVFHPFTPQGVTGVVVLEESHLSIHTWPEHGYASVDFFTCGQGLPDRAHEVIRRGLRAEHAELMMVDRGVSLTGQAMHMRFHRSESETVRAASQDAVENASATIQL